MSGGDGRPVSEATRLADRSFGAFADAAEATNRVERSAYLQRAHRAAGDSALAVAYTFLQQLVGTIAVLLPLVVAGGGYLVGGDGLQSSISAYYYTATGNVFVGGLCALGVFFLSYQHKPLPGYELHNRLSYVAAVAAIGVALFPTAERGAEPWTGEWFVSGVHMSCACTLFLLLAFFSLKLFPETGASLHPSPATRKRNAAFRACGLTIVAAITGALGFAVAGIWFDPPESWHSLFWLETTGVVAFGVSWLVKSGIFGILVDHVPDLVEDVAAQVSDATEPVTPARGVEPAVS